MPRQFSVVGDLPADFVCLWCGGGLLADLGVCLPYLSLTATRLPLQSLELDLEGFEILHHFHGDPIVRSRSLELPRVSLTMEAD